MPTVKDVPSSDEWRARVALLGLDDKEWYRTPEAVRFSGFHASKLYELYGQGEIKSYCLKSHRDAARGMRLWSRDSIRQYLNRKYEESLSGGAGIAYNKSVS
jgi:hypothetical protein